MTEHSASEAHAVHRFCVTHAEPLLPRSWYDDPIALGSYLPESPFHISKLDDFWHKARPLAYGAAGAFGLLNVLSRPPDAAPLITSPLIEVSTNRKRCLPTEEGTLDIGGSGWRDLEVDEAERRTDLARFTPPQGYLFNLPIHARRSVADHYMQVHDFRDLLDYTSLAIELGVLSNWDAQEMLGSTLLIPGGVEIGIFPRDWLVPSLTAIEKVSREFLIRYGDRIRTYDAYQIRAVGFLSERLGSYLLIRDLLAQFTGTRLKDLPNNGFLPLPNSMFGRMTIILEKGASYVAGMATPEDMAGL